MSRAYFYWFYSKWQRRAVIVEMEMLISILMAAFKLQPLTETEGVSFLSIHCQFVSRIYRSRFVVLLSTLFFFLFSP